MIITVTLNPAIDKTVQIQQWYHGGLNRVRSCREDAGGKGINVSKTIKALGGKSLACGFAAGSAGKKIIEELEKLEIDHDFLFVDGETRINTKICEEGGLVTELNEQGPQVSPENLERLINKLEKYVDGVRKEQGQRYGQECDQESGQKQVLVVLAGSAPKGVEATVYKTITERLHKKGATVLLDADGALLKEGIKANPDMIKPNLQELKLLGRNREIQGVGQVVSFAKEMKEKYHIGTMAVSMGAEGAIFLRDHTRLYCPALAVQVSSTVGAGDAIVAAMALAWEQKLDLWNTAKLAMASAAGTVTTQGTEPATLDQVKEIMTQVKMEECTEGGMKLEELNEMKNNT